MEPKKQNITPNLIVTLLVGIFGGWLSYRFFGTTSLSTSDHKANQQVVLKESQAISKIAKDVSPSVVSITVKSSGGINFFGQKIEQESAGTGIIISKSGYILTNKHVVDSVDSEFKVVLSDGTSYEDVKLIGRDPTNDLAYLKIENPKNLKPATIGDSSKVNVGDKVVAIGNALGEFSNTVTSGIISGRSRPLDAGDGASLQNLFQTDAAINPGNSGGPLVNINGEVIGINTAVAGNAENIGFAIPVNDAKSGVESVIEKGKLVKPYLGVRYITISDDIAKSLDLPVKRGVLLDSDAGVSAVLGDSPADKAGLKKGDIITEIAGKKIDETNSLIGLINEHKVGETIKLQVIRDEKQMTVEVTLEEAPKTLGQ